MRYVADMCSWSDILAFLTLVGIDVSIMTKSDATMRSELSREQYRTVELAYMHAVSTKLRIPKKYARTNKKAPNTQRSK